MWGAHYIPICCTIEHLPDESTPALLPSAGLRASAPRTNVFSVLNRPAHPYRYRRFAYPLTGSGVQLAEQPGSARPSFRGTSTPCLVPVRLAHQIRTPPYTPSRAPHARTICVGGRVAVGEIGLTMAGCGVLGARGDVTDFLDFQSGNDDGGNPAYRHTTLQGRRSGCGSGAASRRIWDTGS